MSGLRLLALNASPRRNGNSEYILTRTLEDLPELPWPLEVNRRGLAGQQISPCIGCLACYRNGGRCVLQDDFEPLRQAWIEADAVLYSLPVYHLGLPAQLKCFLDRLGNSFYGYYESGPARQMKAIGALVQGGVAMGGQEMAQQAIMLHAQVLHCFYVTGDGSHMGSGLVAGLGGNRQAFANQEAAADAQFQSALATAQNMLQRLLETAAILKSGLTHLRPVLEAEACYTPILTKIAKEDSLP